MYLFAQHISYTKSMSYSHSHITFNSHNISLKKQNRYSIPYLLHFLLILVVPSGIFEIYFFTHVVLIHVYHVAGNILKPDNLWRTDNTILFWYSYPIRYVETFSKDFIPVGPAIPTSIEMRKYWFWQEVAER